MENHGKATGGTDIVNAFQRFETLEFCTRTIESLIIKSSFRLTCQKLNENRKKNPD